MGDMLILSPHNRLFLGTLILGGGLFFASETVGADGPVKDLEKAIEGTLEKRRTK